MIEPFRPVLHFTPPRGWINDPNGLVYFNGEWHLCFQFFDPDDVLGLQWGHAVSRDLLHWEHLPPAIRPDRHGLIWSGSAVVDRHDTSGLLGGRPGIVCLFTYFDPADQRQSQGLAFSTDGRTFTTYAGNPVIPQLRHLPGQPDDKDFRDPKVFWHAPTGRWIMVVAGGKVRIFSSADLIHWRFESVDEALTTECPDLFELPVAGDPARTRWVLSGAGRWYRLGRFDGQRFTPETDALPMTHGPDGYATQTWSDTPDGRRIAIAWLFAWRYGCGPRAGRIENTFPTTPWSGGCMSLPCELTLAATPDGDRLWQVPAAEWDAWRTMVTEEADMTIRPGAGRPLPPIETQALDLDVELGPASPPLAMNIPAAPGGAYTLRLDPRGSRLTLDRRGAGAPGIARYAECYETAWPADAAGRMCARIVLDRCSLEVFAAGGAAVFAATLLPDAARTCELTSDGGVCRLRRLAVGVLRPT